MVLHDALARELAHDLRDDLRPIPVRADPSGLAFDPLAFALYVADAASGAILRTDGERAHRVATIDADGALEHIAALAITPSGALFVTRVTDGAILRVDPSGAVSELTKLARGVTRLGVTCEPAEHALYATQFHTSVRGAHDGAIVMVDLATGEPSLILDGFARPVGIAKLGATLVVADARQQALFRVELVAGRAVMRLQLAADLGRPDSVCACGPDSVLVTAYDEAQGEGSVHRLWLDGRRCRIASGAWDPRGVTTDGVRVFVSARRAGKVLVFPL